MPLKGVWTSRLLLNSDAFFNIPIVHPPLEEQVAIVAFLEEQTAVINQFLANKRQLITLLEEQKQVVINTAVTQGLDPNAPRKPSGIDWLGDIPVHWKIAKLSRLTTAIGDGLHGTPNYVEKSPYLFINGNNLSKGIIQSNSTTRFVDELEYQKYRVPLDENTLLMSINGTIGNLALYRHEPIILGKSAAFINCREILSREFLFYYLQSQGIRKYFHLEVTGTTIYNLSLASIRSLPTILPHFNEQKEICYYLDEKTAVINTAIERTQREIELIEEYRTTLIAHAVTGKIDVCSGALPAPAGVAPPSPPPPPSPSPGLSRATQPAAARHGDDPKRKII